jgi:hypothetical protein
MMEASSYCTEEKLPDAVIIRAIRPDDRER